MNLCPARYRARDSTARPCVVDYSLQLDIATIRITSTERNPRSVWNFYKGWPGNGTGLITWSLWAREGCSSLSLYLAGQRLGGMQFAISIPGWAEVGRDAVRYLYTWLGRGWEGCSSASFNSLYINY